MRRTVALLLLAIAGPACQASTGPDNPPAWTDETDWRGTLTMKTGTVLAVTFHLASGRGHDMWGEFEWKIYATPARIENTRTGAVVVGAVGGYGWVDTRSVSFTVAAPRGFDDPATMCQYAMDNAIYRLDVTLGDDGTLAGTLSLSCPNAGQTIDSQRVVMQQTRP
jgi:hypothetical protein